MTGTQRFAGVTVTPTSALQCSAWHRGITLLANTTAMLPLTVRKRQGSRELMDAHPLARLLRRPDPAMPRFTWYQTLMGHVLTHGNAYAEIRWNQAGTAVAALSLMDPQDTYPEWDGDKKVYRSRCDPAKRWTASQIFHVPGFGFDGLAGIPALEAARRAISLDLGAEEYGANWFGAGGRPSGVLKHPGEMTPEAAERLKKDWATVHSPGSHVPALLQEGMDFAPFENDPSKAQAIETRRWQVLVVARFLGVPPHMLYAAEGTPFSTVSQMSREFLTFSMSPWLTIIEEEADGKLFTDADRQLYEMAFDESYLLRCDAQTQSQIDNADLNGGIRTVAEVRRDRGLPELPGTNKLRVPLNYGTLNDDGTITNNGLGNVATPQPQKGTDNGTQNQ